MNVFAALMCYLLSVLICAALIYGIVRAFKRNKQKLYVGHLFLGIGIFAVLLVALGLVLTMHLTVKDGVGDYYNTQTYRITIIALLSLLAGVLIWFLTMKIYVKRQAIAELRSFFVGFSALPCCAVGVYCLFMLGTLSISLLSSELIGYNAVNQSYHFAPDSYIFVFEPIVGHISYALVLCLLVCFFMILSYYLEKLAVTQIPFSASFAVFCSFLIESSAFVVFVLFAKMLGIAHFALLFIALALSLVFGLIVFLSARRKKKTEERYEHQFE